MRWSCFAEVPIPSNASSALRHSRKLERPSLKLVRAPMTALSSVRSNDAQGAISSHPPVDLRKIAAERIEIEKCHHPLGYQQVVQRIWWNQDAAGCPVGFVRGSCFASCSHAMEGLRKWNACWSIRFAMDCSTTAGCMTRTSRWSMSSWPGQAQPSVKIDRSTECADLKHLAVVAGVTGYTELAAGFGLCHHRHHGHDRLASKILQRGIYASLLAELDQIARGREWQLEAAGLAAFQRLAWRDPDRVVDSSPSWAPSCSGGAAARKNQVSNRFGMPSGVIQCA